MMEIKMTLKPLVFANHALRTLPQQKTAAKTPAIDSALVEHLFPPDHETLSRMSLSSLLYYALIGDSATAD